ncbi:hypothetical protein [Thalassomonas actiniarum]|uniref:Uncharacterized protein n=1 Tax=Thalassomonas actiniarum TaxID=485447 RepID=A0AAE9YUY7_9GAMM|nr:hypothetical protein [Thalassomonas actiniarum]WDD99977.1 hypothetical protein SG35_004760 [Thalassomonas actiniarum]
MQSVETKARYKTKGTLESVNYTYVGLGIIFVGSVLNNGGWRIEVPGNADLGVGGNRVPYVVLGHLGRQTYSGSK